MGILQAFSSCIGSPCRKRIALVRPPQNLSEKNETTPLLPPPPIMAYPDSKIGCEVVLAMNKLCYDNPANCKAELDQIVGAAGWSEWVAKNVLTAVEQVVKDGPENMGPAMKRAYRNARAIAEQAFYFLVEDMKDNPWGPAASLLLSIIAIGILVELTPFILELLGFGELGPIAGSFASWWEAKYCGLIPKGSIFSFLQRLGMTWTVTSEELSTTEDAGTGLRRRSSAYSVYGITRS